VRRSLPHRHGPQRDGWGSWSIRGGAGNLPRHANPGLFVKVEDGYDIERADRRQVSSRTSVTTAQIVTAAPRMIAQAPPAIVAPRENPESARPLTASTPSRMTTTPAEDGQSGSSVLGWTSTDDSSTTTSGATTLATGEDVALVGGQTLNVSAEEEDGEVTGEIWLSDPDGEVVATVE
jgi:hypothetical protein